MLILHRKRNHASQRRQSSNLCQQHRYDIYVDNTQFTHSELAHSLHHQVSLGYRHNGPDSVSNHQPDDCLFNRLFRRRSKNTSKLRVTGLCAGISPGTGYTETVSIWWRHHVEGTSRLWHGNQLCTLRSFVTYRQNLFNDQLLRICFWIRYPTKSKYTTTFKIKFREPINKSLFM